MLYAFAVWGDNIQSFFDRRMPLEIQRDEGLLLQCHAGPSSSMSDQEATDGTDLSAVEPLSKVNKQRKRVYSRQALPITVLTTQEQGAKKRRDNLEEKLLEEQLRSQVKMQEWFSQAAVLQCNNAALAALQLDHQRKMQEIQTCKLIISDDKLPLDLREDAINNLTKLFGST